MSAACWQRRRVRKRLDIALRTLRRDPDATVTLTVGVVVISGARYERLTAGVA